MSLGSRRPPVKLRRGISNGCRENRVRKFSFGGSWLPQGRGYSPRIEIGRHSTASATILPNGKRESPAVAEKFEKYDFRENALQTKKTDALYTKTGKRRGILSTKNCSTLCVYGVGRGLVGLEGALGGERRGYSTVVRVGVARGRISRTDVSPCEIDVQYNASNGFEQRLRPQ
jgi:hypothetical protein